MSERYEAHIFRWWMHHQFNTPDKEEKMETQFDLTCDRYNISPAVGRRIVKYYLARFEARYEVVFDMGHLPDIQILDLHFAYKPKRGNRPFRNAVLETMQSLHNTHAGKNLAAKRKVLRRANISDLLTRRQP
jgi:hypothetical protein